MQIKNLKHTCISNLVLIILNDKNSNSLRKFAEVELKKRIRNVECNLDDILDFDDKVIKKRGFNKGDYLISQNVDMQKLMETYLTYKFETNPNSDYLLFSEKHLCNDSDFGNPFFSKICAREIENIDKRLKKENSESEKETLLLIKQILEERNKDEKIAKKILIKEPAELISRSDAVKQFEGNVGACLSFLANCSDEEQYKIYRSNFGLLKAGILQAITDTVFDSDVAQSLCGLYFVRKDSSKLSLQKKQLFKQVQNNYEVNYESEQFKKILQKTKK